MWLDENVRQLAPDNSPPIFRQLAPDLQTTGPWSSDNSPPIFRKLAPDLQTTGPQYENTYVTLDIDIYFYFRLLSTFKEIFNQTNYR